MDNLESRDLIRDKGQTIDEELAFDEKFIGEQVESYNKLLESPIMQEF